MKVALPDLVSDGRVRTVYPHLGSNGDARGCRNCRWQPVRTVAGVDATLTASRKARVHYRDSQKGAFVTEEFDRFFQRATGMQPHPYQRTCALRQDFPHLIEVPPGAGKTAAIVIAWLWRRFGSSSAADTPRRLIYAVPMRTLADQVAGSIAAWLAALGLTEEVDLHLAMGGRIQEHRPWRSSPERVTILVGTVDLLTSKSLMRAYGTARGLVQLDAAWSWNDSLRVVDEVQLAPAATSTERQVAAFVRGRTVGASALTCMSATVPPGLLDTVDHPFPGDADIVRLDAADRTGDLGRRLSAGRTVTQVKGTPGDAKAIAAAAAAAHKPGTLTLLVLNTVAAAQAVYAALAKSSTVDPMLLHSRFTAWDRAELVDRLLSPLPPEGRIVVATQVVEAGLDLDAATLVTEAAPWPSLIQRSGRCNRAGRRAGGDADLLWMAPAKPAPYPASDIDAAVAALRSIENSVVSNEDLLAMSVEVTPYSPPILRRRDFEALWDTAPDLSGNDIDISPYIRDADDSDAHLCWLEWQGDPPADLELPPPQFWCRAPMGAIADLAKRAAVWRRDQVDGRWRRIGPSNRARPGEALLMRAADGGYTRDLGLAPASRALVTPPAAAQTESTSVELVERAEDGFAQDPLATSAGQWLPLDVHSEDAAEQARVLVDGVGLLSDNEGDDVVLAARLHDVGKAHPTWQDALIALATESEAGDVQRRRPLAKSPSRARLRFAGTTTFRHEFASVLLLDGPLAPLLAAAHDRDLVRYLVMAHHGKLRIQVRDALETRQGWLVGVEQGSEVEIPRVLGVGPSVLRADLEHFRVGAATKDAPPGWASMVRTLVRTYGPQRLVYLESLVRIADWRASALRTSESALAAAGDAR